MYWYCVELIAQNISDTNITFELEHDARIIARNLNLTVQETKDMMQKMIKLELFSITKNNKLACYALAKRLDQSMTSNSKFRNLISQIKEQNHDSIMTKSIDSHDKVMQEEKRREEKRREKKNKSISTNIDFNQEILTIPTNELNEKHFSLSKPSLFRDASSEYLETLERYINNYVDKLEMEININGGNLSKVLKWDDFYLGAYNYEKKYVNFAMTYHAWARRSK